MKQVYPSDEIAHLWAHKTQESARTQRGNFYFNGDTIYSYGSHFPIARHVTNKRKQEAVLFTMRTSSNTTARHCSDVRHAVRHLHVLEVPDVYGYSGYSTEAVNARTIDAFERAYDNAIESCVGPTGRSRPKQVVALEQLTRKANAFAEFIGDKKRWTPPSDTAEIAAIIAKRQAADARKSKAQDKRNAAARAAHLELLTNAMELWKAGKDVRYHLGDLPVGLRIVGDQVETSLGASVPLAHAAAGLALVRRIMQRGKPYQRNGHTVHLGHYAIDSIAVDGTLHAGCHTILIEEINRIAPQIEALIAPNTVADADTLNA